MISCTKSDIEGKDSPTTPTITLKCTVKITPIKVLGGTGSIAVKIISGNKPYKFTLDNVESTDSIFASLKAGSHSLSVSDAKQQTFSATETLTEPTKLTATVTSTNVTVFGGTNGSITVTMVGGTSPYKYKLDNGSFRSTNKFDSLSVKSYTVLVNDSNGDTTKVSNITVGQPNQLIATSTITNVTTFGGHDGSIIVSVSGGVSPYTYLWNNNSTTSTISNLVMGTYGVKITDSNGAITTLSNLTVTQPTEPTLTATSTVTNVTTFGGTNGTITLTVSGGVSPYTYLWNTIATTSSISNLTAGTYSVTVNDNNGCIFTLNNIVVTQPAEPILTSSMTLTNVTTYGGNNGSITVNPDGGVSPYTYSLNGATFQTPNVFNVLIAGTYNVTVKDANGCTLSLTNIVITQPAVPTIHVGDSKNGGVVFSVNSDGVTGLIAYPSTNPILVWGLAKSTCEGKGTGWRLPTISELMTLLTVAKTNSSLSYITMSGSYWSGTQNVMGLKFYDFIGITGTDKTLTSDFTDITVSTTKYSSIAVKSF